MPRRLIVSCILVLLIAVTLPALLAGHDAQQTGSAAPSGWVLPPDADDKKNPLTVDEKLLATGRAVYKDKCTRCHGPGGLGDGPDADPDARENMDLTDPMRADMNSDGTVFYKVWNGRKRPKMPTFSSELTEEQAWAVVAYAQSLRKK